MITIIGLGPAGLDRVHQPAHGLLTDEARVVVVRTLDHPAAAALAGLRAVVSCDDLYEAAADYDSLYQGIARRVCEVEGPVVYAVPGSALVGERAVPLIRETAAKADRTVEVLPGESFLDLAMERVGVDPIADGLQVLDARDLPDPMPLHLPTLITQLDTPGTAAELAAELGRVLAYDTPVTVLSDLGSAGESITQTTVKDLPRATTGPRTSAFVKAHEVGWIGLIRTNRVLREQCPWDNKQTHHSLLRHLVEEAYETIDAVEQLPLAAPEGDVDFGAYAAVEEELGDLLLQVVFHATMAREAGAFDVEEVAEGIRSKLVARHPHVFGDLQLDDASAVEANWERLKKDEKRRESPMDDVPAALPGLARAEKIQRRAASVGFDWIELGPVIAKLVEEVGELQEAIGDSVRTAAELGDVLFAAVNVSRHVGVDADLAVRAATGRFEARFRWIEAHLDGRDMGSMSLDELDTLWDAAKRQE
ncbi:MAG: nucleoside triphosphate pyrophosphohydrolase [bacterium]|nr:nucleoside triphosphate pyrophosphohydrolase [bacterium]